jgi:uncharacterized protein YheU (UPF0270 family)
MIEQDRGAEEGVEIPYEQIDPQTLRRMIEEFVTRDWSDFGESGSDLEIKIEQVLRQLREKKVKVVFDLRTETANIVAAG